MNAPSRFSVACGEKNNNVEHKNSNMRVVVRVRPPNEREMSQGKVNVIKVIDDCMLTFDPKEEDIAQMSSTKPRMSVLEKRIRDLHFAFDHVFHDQATNEEVFQHTTKPVIESVLQGYNCSVFAYGATSAGKTHTMLGSPNSPGVIFLTMMELYKKLVEIDQEYETDITVSYLEIYNETCKDLLLPTGPLAVREDPEKRVCVAGLSLHKPRSPEELLEMLHFGNQNRTQHPTDANKQSSRSHAVFQVFVRQCPKISGITTKVKLSKVSLIDLAGSERATVTTNRGDRLREGANINKSLLALGNCINALAENKSNKHVPYRNSKLTRLLKDSLGGNCRTIMIAAVSPSTLSYEDTYNTLKYANRAKNIKSSISANSLNVEYHVSQYAKIIEDLEAQIVLLKDQLSAKNMDQRPVDNNRAEKFCKNYLKLQEYSEELEMLFQEKCLFLKQLVECKAMEKELLFKLTQKERSYNRLKIIRSLSGDIVVCAEKKIDQFFCNTTLKQSKWCEQVDRLKASLEENNDRIMQLQNEIDEWSNQCSQSIRSSVNQLYESLSNEVERAKLEAKYKHAKRYTALQETDQRNNEKVMSQLLEIIEAQQCKWNTIQTTSSYVITPTLKHQLDELPGCLLAGPKISWADETLPCEKDVKETFETTKSGFLDDYTPLKTPSRKMTLRKMVLESRSGLDNTTDFNTAMNIGPKRSYPVSKRDVNGPEQDEDRSTLVPNNLNATFLISSSSRPPSDEHRKSVISDISVKTLHNNTCDCPNTGNDTSSDNNKMIKTFIPVNTALKALSSGSLENIPSLVARPRMRSFTEGIAKKLSVKESIHSSRSDVTFATTKSSFDKNLLYKKRNLNLGPASRSVPNLNKLGKENVCPRNKQNTDPKSRCLSTNKKSTSKRFRF